MRLFANCKVAMSMVVALCLVISQIEPAAMAQAPQSSSPPQQQPAPQSEPSQAKPRRSKLKWILIGATVVGGVAAALLIKNRKSGPEPVVTVGGPSIGSPQ